ncbi:MAG: hypothetical protein VX610_04165, partial [SAR324 cluster bacterium]|nr:hypothetical protein [SAR324 cluster bacterium]
LEALAQVGGICVSKNVHEAVHKKMELEFNDLGQQKVKNTVMHAVDISVEGVSKRKPPQPHKQSSATKLAILAAAVVLMAAGAGIYANIPKFDEEKRVLFGDLSVVVLPLKNVSGDAKDGGFVNGLSNSIRTLVAKTKRFSVISQTTSSAYKNSEKPLKEIADELNVDYLIEGGFQRLGEDVSINVSMVEAETGKMVWEQTYQEKFELSLRLQQEIALNIASHLTNKYGGFWATLVDQEMPDIGLGQPENMDAHQLVLAGWGQFFMAFRGDTVNRLLSAVDFGKQALEVEEATETYGMLAYSYGRLAGETKERKYFDEAVAIAEKGLNFDPTADLIYRAMGFAEFDLRPKFEKTEPDLQTILGYYDKSIQYNPSDSNAYTWKALIYAKFGQGEKAVKSTKRALELSPKMQGWECWPYAFAYFAVRDFQNMLTISKQGTGCRQFAAIGAHALGQKEAALQLFGEYVQRYKKRYKKEYTLDVLQARKHFEVEAENEEYLRRFKAVYDAWAATPQS